MITFGRWESRAGAPVGVGVVVMTLRRCCSWCFLLRALCLDLSAARCSGRLGAGCRQLWLPSGIVLRSV